MSDDVLGDLVERIAKQDRDAFDELYRLLSTKIYGYLRLRLSNESGIEDILQDTFLSVWRQASSFQRASKATTWVFGIARHKLQDWLRIMGRPANEQLDSETWIQEDFAPRVVAKLSFEQALRTLTPEGRELVYLVFVERWPYQDIARLLCIPEGTVKSRVHHLKRQLSVLLREEVTDGE